MGGGGGGGSTDIDLRDPGTEWPSIKKWYGRQQKQLYRFTRRDPLFHAAQSLALQGNRDVTASLKALPWAPQIAALEPGRRSQAAIIASGGALTPELKRQSDQAALSLAAGAGMANSPQGIASALLNREQYRQQRLQSAIGAEQGITGAQQQIASGRQALVTGGLNQLNQSALAPIQGFTTLENPILQYLSTLYGGNLQAQVAQAQINAQQQQASQGQKGSTIGGGISAIGSIAGMAL